jgi:hypothetical protein
MAFKVHDLVIHLERPFGDCGEASAAPQCEAASTPDPDQEPPDPDECRVNSAEKCMDDTVSDRRRRRADATREQLTAQLLDELKKPARSAWTHQGHP